MHIITPKHSTDEGAYAVHNEYGEKVVFFFVEKDDAERYAMMLEDDEQYKKEMTVIEVDDELAIKTCRMYNYKYTVITPDDFVIPPHNDNLSKD